MTLAAIQLIRTGAEITDEWLTSVFRASGDLTDSQSVTSHKSVSLGDAAGLLGELFRVELQFSDSATGPQSVVIKFPASDPQQRGVADALGFYTREVTFYNEHVEGLPFGVPRSYGAVQDTEGTDFVLVMEDVGHLDQIDQVAGASLDQARTAISEIAKFHAQWWAHPDLEAMGETFIPLSAPLYLAVLPGIFASGWPNCLSHESHNLTEGVTDFGNSYGDFLPFLLGELASPATLVHGDFRGDNLLFDSSGGLTIIDFQITGVAHGLYDVAYFMCQSIDSDVRHGHDESLIQLYVDTLSANGVDVAVDEAMRLYRVASAFCLIYAVTSFQAFDAFDGRQHELMSKMLSRTVRTIEDNDALSVLPQS